MRRLSLAGLAWLVVATAAHAQDLKDKRLTTPPISYNEKYYHWAPPATKEAWEARRPVVREQLLVSQGLWPMPEKSPLQPVIHGKIERDGYTVEKVFFASVPGHYVTGNLYRPTGRTGKLPAVLCPHGHWANGRLYQANDWQQQMKSAAEQTKEGALYPLQARCAQLARLGCVVFFYDMVGVADSIPIGHRLGFKDADAELRLHNFMGLQTWNSVRALDFILALPEVDASRVAITGASGGGTQSFVLAAFDDTSQRRSRPSWCRLRCRGAASARTPATCASARPTSSWPPSPPPSRWRCRAPRTGPSTWRRRACRS